MPSTARAQLGRVVAVVGLVGVLLLPAGRPVAAQGMILRAGAVQDAEVLNPWHVVTPSDHEILTLNYDLLVGFGQDLEPVPGFAESWSPSPDGMTHTFKIRAAMTWSDGTPATAEDARWTYQLVLDAVASDAGGLGSYYLEPNLTNAGLKAVDAPDATTLVVETAFPTTLITQAYVPILPKHIWEGHSLDEIGNAASETFFHNEPPVVGTGPYQAVDWEPGNLVRFERNESYWGEQGAADEVIIQSFDSADTMVRALRAGEVDYVRGLGAEQFGGLGNEEDVVAVEGFGNGYAYLCFNTGGNANGFHASTSATADPKFRDAVGYALDLERLVDTTMDGHGLPGTTQVPPYHVNWHVPPADPRTFDLDEAKRRLDAAGYALDTGGRRLDKEGRQIALRLTWPDSEADMATNARSITGWFSELGIEVDAEVTDERKLIDDLTGPHNEPPGVADWDLLMWGWVGDPDPLSLLSFFTTDQLGGLNDSFYTNERYDELFGLQQRALDPQERKGYIAEMQEIFYRDAPYHILNYDSELHAYRTDRFGGWLNQPRENGTPLFGYGSIGYTGLTPAVAATSEPSAASPGAGASAAPTPAPETGGGVRVSDATPILIGLAAVLAVSAVGVVRVRRRREAVAREVPET